MIGFKTKIESKLVNAKYDDPYQDEWYENHEPDVISIEDQSPDVVTLIGNYQSGDTVYLVWVEYTYGDSFGYYHCAGVESIAVFKQLNFAKDLQAHIIENDDSKGFISGDGQLIHIPSHLWNGYFEHLENVYVSEVKIL